MRKGKKKKFIQLGTLIRDSKGMVECVTGDPSLKISSVEYNSKKVIKNSLFVAIPGFTSDGHKFIDNAVEAGAAAVVVSADRSPEFEKLGERGVAVLSSPDTRRALAVLSASFFGFPCAKVPVIGVTGTNGKTSITYMLESIFSCSGYSPGVIGTVNYRWCGKGIQSANTTPEARDLQEIFANMVSDGVDIIIMEVSSHGLKLFRADRIDFDTVIFTNLTRDHLDFHDNFEDYFASKKRIFSLLEESSKEKKCAVVNIDNEYGRNIFSEKDNYSYPMYSVGVENDADYLPEKNSISSTIEGLIYNLEKPEPGTHVSLNVAGRFHIYNSLCSFAAAHRMGLPVKKITKGLAALRVVPGRFDTLKSNLGFSVVVDYAHTDDALINLLSSARALAQGRVITVFGCGGNRDKTKRPLMGKAAAANSDRVIVTSDNPRNEKPEDIINDIVAGMDAENFEVEPDRREAIRKAIDMAKENDLIIIAGKGHEDYQIIGGQRKSFDDRQVAGMYIKEKEGKGSSVESRL